MTTTEAVPRAVELAEKALPFVEAKFQEGAHKNIELAKEWLKRPSQEAAMKCRRESLGPRGGGPDTKEVVALAITQEAAMCAAYAQQWPNDEDGQLESMDISIYRF